MSSLASECLCDFVFTLVFTWRRLRLGSGAPRVARSHRGWCLEATVCQSPVSPVTYHPCPLLLGSQDHRITEIQPLRQGNCHKPREPTSRERKDLEKMRSFSVSTLTPPGEGAAELAWGAVGRREVGPRHPPSQSPAGCDHTRRTQSKTGRILMSVTRK